MGIDKFRDFVIYTKFTIKTDCQALKYAIHKCDFEDAAMVRWIMQLSQYSFDIEFVKGEKNSFADMLSREFLSKHSIQALQCNYIRRIEAEESSVEIETPTGWIRFYLELPLLIHDTDVWYPFKEVRHREGIPYLWTETMQDEMNQEAVEALEYLEHIDNIHYTLHRDDDDDDRITSCHITIRRFDNPLHREDYDPDRQKESFFTAMNLQNCSANLFYALQSFFLFEGMTAEALEQEDPTPDWFVDWWRIYGLSALVIKPYTLHMLKIPGFSEPRSHMSGIVYKNVGEIADISDLSFLQAIRRCGHIRWFVTNYYKARAISSSTNYEDFHNQIDMTSNPFETINFLEPPNQNRSQMWESEKEIRVQYFNNHLIETYRYQHYSHPQIEYYVMD